MECTQVQSTSHRLKVPGLHSVLPCPFSCSLSSCTSSPTCITHCLSQYSGPLLSHCSSFPGSIRTCPSSARSTIWLLPETIWGMVMRRLRQACAAISQFSSAEGSYTTLWACSRFCIIRILFHLSFVDTRFYLETSKSAIQMASLVL